MTALSPTGEPADRVAWLLALQPSDTPDYMIPAWLGCIRWALGVPEIVRQFREESGNRWQPSCSPIGELIDRATGAERAFYEDFIRWANDEVWGPMDAVPADPAPSRDAGAHQ